MECASAETPRTRSTQRQNNGENRKSIIQTCPWRFLMPRPRSSNGVGLIVSFVKQPIHNLRRGCTHFQSEVQPKATLAAATPSALRNPCKSGKTVIVSINAGEVAPADSDWPHDHIAEMRDGTIKDCYECPRTWR